MPLCSLNFVYCMQMFFSCRSLQGLTLRHDLSCASHISKLASKAKCRLGILRHVKSFLGTPELLSTDKAFICSLMDSCSLLWAGSPASHLAQLDAVETKAFKIIGVCHDEAETMGLSLCHRRQVCGLSIFFHLISDLAPSALSVLCPPPPRYPKDTRGPPATPFS